MHLTAAALVEELNQLADPAEAAKIRRRVAPTEPVIGVRMGSLFDVARAATKLPDDELQLLFGHPAYEPRMAAFSTWRPGCARTRRPWCTTPWGYSSRTRTAAVQRCWMTS